MKIGVAGAGIAGLSAAALLAKQGHAVTVFDQFRSPRPIGSGLMIQPVGLDVLARLGLETSVRAAASPIARILGQTDAGRTVLDVSYADLKDDLNGLAIQRGVLFQMLLDAALDAGAKLVADTTVTGARTTEKQAFLQTATGESEPFDLVIDALGAYSVLCPRPSKPLAYGALWALLDWPDGSALARDRLEQRYRHASNMVGVLPVGRASDGVEKLTFFWSLRGQDHARWRATPIQRWKEEVEVLWPETAPVLDQIAGHDDLIFAQYTHHTVPRPGQGRIAHLGDSHHATSPQLGQGANMGLLDAAALADALATQTDPVQATAAYGRARRRHVWLYQTASWLFTPLYQSDSRLLPWIRDWLAAPAARVPPAPHILAKLVAGTVVKPIR